MAKLIVPQDRRLYSYLRFSDPQQREGDSIRRQDDAAKRYAERHGLVLDTTLRMTDEGLSGFYGTNRKKGALGAFLAEVEAGEVPVGSTLLVENVDRLSREDFVTAFATITQIICAGIAIVTLSPPAEYTRESIAGGLVWQLVGQMQIAHEESKKKSERIRGARNQARKLARSEGRILTKKAPGWLTVKDGKFHAIPKAAKTIRKIFDLKLSGMGIWTIEKTLNREAAWTLENGWSVNYIRKILSSRTVIGEYQPYMQIGGKSIPEGEPIQGYYPVVVKPATFHAVQRQMKNNIYTGGQNGKATNVFRHLVKCAYCGGAMHFRYKKNPSNAKYLVCDKARRRFQCDAEWIRYPEVETAILENCHRIQPELVLPNRSAKVAESKRLRESINGWSFELQEIEQQVENLTDQIASTKLPKLRERYEKRIVELLNRRKPLEKKINDGQQRLVQLESGIQSFAEWQQNLGALQQALKSDDVTVKLKLRAHLREFIERIDVFSRGYAHEWDHETETGDSWGESMLDMNPKPNKQFRQFVAHVMKRRSSKEGRFVRVHFKTGHHVDIVPPGSIATSFTELADRETRRIKRPAFDQLWQDFIKGAV
jgi:DNA invertase Pin-like site-specific DNA recombinase